MNKRKFFALYLVLLCAVLFIRKTDGLGVGFEAIRERLATSVNIVPLSTVRAYRRAVIFETLPIWLYILNIHGNILLFFPLGLMLPSIIKPRLAFLRSCCTSLLMILGAEAIQLLLGVGRADIDDVILNFIGAFAGIVINRIICIQKKKKQLARS